MTDAIQRAILDRLDEIQERLKQLEEGMHGVVREYIADPRPSIPVSLSLTPTERAVLEMILSRRNASFEALAGKYFSGSSDGIRTMHVHVCNLRKKLRPYGLTIHTTRGVGFWVSSQDKQKLCALED